MPASLLFRRDSGHLYSGSTFRSANACLWLREIMILSGTVSRLTRKFGSSRNKNTPTHVRTMQVGFDNLSCFQKCRHFRLLPVGLSRLGQLIVRKIIAIGDYIVFWVFFIFHYHRIMSFNNCLMFNCTVLNTFINKSNLMTFWILRNSLAYCYLWWFWLALFYSK